MIAAFESEGLDAFAYGVCCHDKWREYDGRPVEVDESNIYHEQQYQIDGVPVEPDNNGDYPEQAELVEIPHDTVYRDRYSLRETEALWFVQAATQARLDKLEAAQS